MVITLIDVAQELEEKKVPYEVVGIRNIVDKEEIMTKLLEALAE